MKKLLQSLFILLFVASTATAQNRTITGTVTSKEDGLPIPGVSVKVKGTNIGASTGANGRFTLSVPSNATTLEFSSIGFAAQTISIGSSSTINISLSASTKDLSEVVVTGVGAATSKKLVPIEVATLGAKDFPKSATTNVTQALQGQIAGAQIVQRSGQPGANPLIVLRGINNLGSASPLIMIDGVQTSSDLLTDLDPNVVDRIEIVKGSAGGMLYGAQGGNGVIQIFTKRGANNTKLTIDVASRYSNDRVIALNDLVAKNHHWVTDAAGNILSTTNQPIARSAIGVWPNPTAMPFGTDKTVQNNKPINLPTFNHIDQGNRVANTYTNSLNIRGGAEKYDYSFGASNLAQQDVYSNSFNRTNLTLNFGFQPVKGLSLRSATQLITTKEDLLASNRFNLVNSLQWIDFTWRNPNNGQLVVKPSTLTDGNNALAEREARERYSKTPRIVQSFSANYKFAKFLEFDVKYALDARNIEQSDFYFNQTGRAQTVFFGSDINGSITKEYENSRVHYANATAFFRTDFQNDFNLNIPLKTTTQFTYDSRLGKRDYFYAQGVGLPAYPPYTLSSATTRTGGDGSYLETLVYGFLVNQTFDYANLFGISVGFRSDYSSEFGGQGKPANFPRGTIYFNPSELFKNKNFVTNWKLRAAYAEAGVQPSAYSRQITFSRGNFGESGSTLYTRSIANNADLTLSNTSELEIGTDLNLTPLKGNWLSNAVLTATYWKRKSSDVYLDALAAPSTGGSGVRDNLVSMASNGLDISLDLNTYKSQNFDWNFGFRWAKAKAEITNIENNVPVTNGVFNLPPNGDLGNLYMQRPLSSIDQLKPDGTRYIPAANAANYTVVNGYVVNLTNYNVVLTGADDLAVVGNVNPDFTASFINRFTLFKKLTVGVQLDWIKGVDIYNQTRQWLYRDRLHADFDESINIAGQQGSFVAFYNSLYNTNTPLSHFVEDGSYVRLRDVSVTYDLTNVIKQKWVRSLSITATGRNLATWTKYKGLDPEATSALTNQGATISGLGSFTGVDYYGAPNLKSFQFSVNIGF